MNTNDEHLYNTDIEKPLLPDTPVNLFKVRYVPKNDGAGTRNPPHPSSSTIHDNENENEGNNEEDRPPQQPQDEDDDDEVRWPSHLIIVFSLFYSI